MEPVPVLASALSEGNVTVVVLNRKQACAQGSCLCALSVLHSLHVLFFSFVMRSVDSNQCKFCCYNSKGNISKTRHSKEYFFAEMHSMSPFWKNASRWPAGPSHGGGPCPRQRVSWDERNHTSTEHVVVLFQLWRLVVSHKLLCKRNSVSSGFCSLSVC